MEKIKVYKRKYIVNRQLQLSVLLYSLLLSLSVSLTNFAFQSIVLHKLTIISNVNLYIVGAVGMLLVLLLAVFSGVIFTNRIAGPIFRLRQHMEDAAEGKEIKALEFRSTDYFSELIEPYNRILTQIKKK